MDRQEVTPKCVVLSCIGGSQGDLSVVRTLGRAGVEVVLVSEYPDTIAKYSRYVKEFYCLEKTFDCHYETLEFLKGYAAKQIVKPVLFPTADPDLMMVSELRTELMDYYRLFVSSEEIVDNFVDKGKFFEFASKYSFPVPATVVPERWSDVEQLNKNISFPVIMKPTIPPIWGKEAIARIVNGKKAMKIESMDELAETYKRIAEYDRRVVIQEYIPGRDDQLYSLHIFMDKNCQPTGYFTGRKIRTYPTYAGIGCFVSSEYIPEIVTSGIRMLQSIEYKGLALMQFKCDPRDGRYKLIEINPRASSWNLLAYACGVNLPYIAYRDAAGLPLEKVGTQREGINYCHLEHDLRAFLDYRKQGDWNWFSWLASLHGKKVFQYYSSDDLKVFAVQLKRNIAQLSSKLITRLTAGAQKRKGSAPAAGNVTSGFK